MKRLIIIGRNFCFAVLLIFFSSCGGGAGLETAVDVDLQYPAELKDVVPTLVVNGALFKSAILTDATKGSEPTTASFSNTDRTKLTLAFQDVSDGDYYLQLLLKYVEPSSNSNKGTVQIAKSAEQEKCEQDLWETARPYCESQHIEEQCKESIHEECNRSPTSEVQDGGHSTDTAAQGPVIQDEGAMGKDTMASLVAKVSFSEENRTVHVSFPITDFDLSFDADKNGQTNLSEVIASLPIQWSWSRHDTDFSFSFKDVVYGGDSFVAVGQSGKIAFSHDGVNWSEANSGITDTLYGVAFGRGVFVAVGYPHILYSNDGSQWTVASIDARFFIDILFTNDLFYALDYQGRVYRSSDGSLWNQVNQAVDGTISYSNMFNAIAFGHDLFVAVGNGGRISTATGNDFNWISASSQTTEKIYSVSFLNGSFFAVGDGGTILVSPDGSNWTKTNTGVGTSEYLRDITFNNGKYVAVSISDAFISTNGSNWQRSYIGGFGIAGLAFGQNKFVAVGSSFMWTSP